MRTTPELEAFQNQRAGIGPSDDPLDSCFIAHMGLGASFKPHVINPEVIKREFANTDIVNGKVIIKDAAGVPQNIVPAPVPVYKPVSTITNVPVTQTPVNVPVQVPVQVPVPVPVPVQTVVPTVNGDPETGSIVAWLLGITALGLLAKKMLNRPVRAKA